MPYDVRMVQLNTTAVGGWGTGVVAASVMGFPAGNFASLLYSQWMCSAAGASGPSGISPSFTAGISNFVVGPAHGTLTLGNVSGQFFTGSFAPFTGGLRTHLLLSINTQTRIIQLYLNDQLVAVAGTWTGAPGSNWFNLGTGSASYAWNGENSAITNPPAVADIWCAAPAAFVDISVATNRRKFINTDLSPVYLGTDGSEPLGSLPQIYCTMQTGGAPNDLLSNHGTGASFGLGSGNTLVVQAPGICTLPPPPPPPPPRLAMDNVIATASPLQLEVNLISLKWSDDRGHAWGSPVTQDIGEAGEYRTSLQWQRLGMARDRCFEISWSVPMRTALQGCWVDVTPAQS